MEELLELALKRIENLEKKVEKYFHILKIDNELDFVLNGTYLSEDDVGKIISGEQ